MSNPDHWNWLASSLGAEVPKDAPATEDKPSPANAPVRPPAVKKPATPKPQRPRTDWSQLANELGLEPANEPTSTPVAESTPTAPARAPEQPLSEPPRKRPPSMFESAHERAAAEVQEPAFQQADKLDDADDMVDLPEAFAIEVEGEVERIEIIDAELVDETSLGEPTTRAEDEEHGRRRRRRRRGGRRSKRGRPPGEVIAEGEPRDEQPEEADDLTAPPSIDGEESQSDDEPRERKGRRRRRRRGTGRERVRATGQRDHRDDETGERSDSDPDDDVETEDAAIATESEQRETAGDDDPGNGEGSKNSHRAIPSWEDAVGIIISHNLEARAKNARSGGPRGRGRGGARTAPDQRSS